MGSIVVCGGSVIGLSAAMMLAADGHQVTVLESNPQGAPTSALEAWESRERKGVAQFHQPHTLFARFRQILDEELPGMVERLVAAEVILQVAHDEPLDNGVAGLQAYDAPEAAGAERFIIRWHDFTVFQAAN